MTAPRMGVGLRIVLIVVVMKLQIVQCSAVHVNGFLDYMSLTALRLALPLAWMTSIFTLLRLVMKLVILTPALNFPFLMRLTALLLECCLAL